MALDVTSINLKESNISCFKAFRVECVKKSSASHSSSTINYILELQPLVLMAGCIEQLQTKDLAPSKLADLYSDMFLYSLADLENEFTITNFKFPFNA